jgi:hypothetical protein
MRAIFEDSFLAEHASLIFRPQPRSGRSGVAGQAQHLGRKLIRALLALGNEDRLQASGFVREKLIVGGRVGIVLGALGTEAFRDHLPGVDVNDPEFETGIHHVLSEVEGQVPELGANTLDIEQDVGSVGGFSQLGDIRGVDVNGCEGEGSASHLAGHPRREPIVERAFISSRRVTY